jgi:hypothetical protein
MSNKKVQEEEVKVAVEEKVAEAVFEGGPSQAKIDEFKSRFGQIYLTEFDDEVFIWRTLTRKEFKEIMKTDGADALYREERICEKCVLWPEKYDFMAMTTGKAGTPTLLSEQIMDRSGFTAKTGPIML